MGFKETIKHYWQQDSKKVVVCALFWILVLNWLIFDNRIYLHPFEWGVILYVWYTHEKGNEEVRKLSNPEKFGEVTSMSRIEQESRQSLVFGMVLIVFIFSYITRTDLHDAPLRISAECDHFASTLESEELEKNFDRFCTRLLNGFQYYVLPASFPIETYKRKK